MVYKKTQYNISILPAFKGKGEVFMYSINFEELKLIDAKNFDQAIKKVHDIIDKGL